jgi:alkanesulfonate monooxygenase SsuD/methylene tetrahydromethanopterin reductase-like flavin-dependent oxidoreductase (luciferase family)
MAADAVAAEGLGYDSVWVMDHFFIERGGRRVLGGPEPLAFLNHVAARTERIELGTLVLSAPFRAAAQLAREARTLETASGGRFILGIGAGWHQPEFDAFGFPFDHLVTRLEEYLETLIPLLDHGAVFGDPAPLPWIAGGRLERGLVRAGSVPLRGAARRRRGRPPGGGAGALGADRQCRPVRASRRGGAAVGDRRQPGADS